MLAVSTTGSPASGGGPSEPVEFPGGHSEPVAAFKVLRTHANRTVVPEVDRTFVNPVHVPCSPW